jgi:hypothetical protein
MEHNPARFFRILILITCISLQFTCSNTGEATSTPSADSTVVVNARIVLEEVSDVQISSGLYGYNTANLFTHLDIENDDWKELGDGLPAVLRFPGGTLANFWSFRESCPPNGGTCQSNWFFCPPCSQSPHIIG